MKHLRGWIRFLFSKMFLIQLIIAVVFLIIAGFVSLEWLEQSTNHNQKITVPSLYKLAISEATKIASDQKLRIKIREDSVSYNPDFPKFSVVEQDPKSGMKVKENRKIYVTLNPSGYRKIKVPNVLYQTRRQAEPLLVASGFKIGTIAYRPNMSDQVLQMQHKGKVLQPGTKIMKTSTIDLIVGDGRGKRTN